MELVKNDTAIEEGLIFAEKNACKLFQEVERRNIIAAGKTEKDINKEVYSLAQEMFGIKKYWHKRVVRAGPNTLFPYRENPPNLTVGEDDIVFLDFGPIFEKWEADFGRTYVLGNDIKRHKLKRDVEDAFVRGKEFFNNQPKCTGSQLFNYVCSLAPEYGWTYGGPHAGHLIGEFPHEKIQGDEIECYIHPENHQEMRNSDVSGCRKHWILEIHFVDRELKIGAFFEQLLTIEY